MDEKLLQFLDPRIKQVFDKMLLAEQNSLVAKQKTEEIKDLPYMINCSSGRASELNEFTIKQIPYERQMLKTGTININ